MGGSNSDGLYLSSLDDRPVTQTVCTVWVAYNLSVGQWPRNSLLKSLKISVPRMVSNIYYTSDPLPSFISNGLAERAVRVVKEGLKKQNTSDTLTNRLSRVLLSYRITPQSTTGITPAELLFGRNLRSKLDLSKPSADKKRSEVVTKQQVQKQNHDKHSKGREFQIGDHVYVKNRSNGDRWLAGTVTTVSGPVSYNVRLSDGRVWKCHQDQLRKRYMDTAESDVVDVPTGDSPPAVVDTSSHNDPDPPVPGDQQQTPEPRRYPERIRQRPSYHESVQS